MKKINDRQLEIIEAAGKLLTLSGVKGLTIKNLAREMKFTESAIYRHFHNKEAIIITLIDFLAQNMEDRYHKAVKLTLSPEENLVRLFKSDLTYFKKNQHFVAAVFSDGLFEESQNVKEAIFRIMQVKQKYLITLIQEGQEKGIFTNDISVDEIVHIMMGSFRLQKFKWKISNFKFDIKKDGEQKLKSILQLIKL